MMTASARLNRVLWFKGQTVEAEQMVAMDTAFTNREKRTRNIISTKYLKRIPTMTIVDLGAGEPRIDDFVAIIRVDVAPEGA
jgi:hypothetical protein